MVFDYYGDPNLKGNITPLVDLLMNVDASQRWEYMGLKVEIDPTIDFNNQNVLVRWLDVNEGFNDRIIFYSLNEFNTNFTTIND